MSWYDNPANLAWLGGPIAATAAGADGTGGVKNWLVGGDAANSVDPNLRNGDWMSGFIKNQLGQGGRNAPQAGYAQVGNAAQLNLGANGQIDSRMMGLADRLGGIASGQQKGAGEMAVDRQVGQATAAQQAMARMARGANAALAARQAARSQADLGVAGAGQAQQAALGDQSSANQLLGGLLGGMRGQNIDAAGQNAQLLQQQRLANAGFRQQSGLANQSAGLQQQGINNNYQMGLLAQLLGIDTATLQAQLARANVAAADQGHLGALLQQGGSMAAGMGA